MDSTNEKLVLQLKNNKKAIFEYEIELIKFQKEIVENESISFFYTFKDMRVELEEQMLSKLKLNSSRESTSFVISYAGKILYDSAIDAYGINENNISQNEVQLYFIFEKISKNIINKISEEHKSLILSNSETLKNG